MNFYVLVTFTNEEKYDLVITNNKCLQVQSQEGGGGRCAQRGASIWYLFGWCSRIPCIDGFSDKE